jgi:glucosamine-6-phosphate deaminase
MEIKIFTTAAEAAEFVANQVTELVTKNPKVNIGVATGRTMDAVYFNLCQGVSRENLSFSEVSAFAVDEYIGLEQDSVNSYRSYLDLHLFDRLNFSKNNIHVPDVFSNDLDIASNNYEELIQGEGGIDLQLLGIGLNGHIGLNEPGSSEDSRTRVIALTSSTKNSNKVLFRNEHIPVTALTMGVGTILESKKCILIATGETKAEIILKLVNGDVNSKIPATALKKHSNMILVLDKESASLI